MFRRSFRELRVESLFEVCFRGSWLIDVKILVSLIFFDAIKSIGAGSRCTCTRTPILREFSIMLLDSMFRQSTLSSRVDHLGI